MPPTRNQARDAILCPAESNVSFRMPRRNRRKPNTEQMPNTRNPPPDRLRRRAVRRVHGSPATTLVFIGEKVQQARRSSAATALAPIHFPHVIEYPLRYGGFIN